MRPPFDRPDGTTRRASVPGSARGGGPVIGFIKAATGSWNVAQTLPKRSHNASLRHRTNWKLSNEHLFLLLIDEIKISLFNWEVNRIPDHARHQEAYRSGNKEHILPAVNSI
jgi:hypothetical protein